MHTYPSLHAGLCVVTLSQGPNSHWYITRAALPLPESPVVGRRSEDAPRLYLLDQNCTRQNDTQTHIQPTHSCRSHIVRPPLRTSSTNYSLHCGHLRLSTDETSKTLSRHCAFAYNQPQVTCWNKNHGFSQLVRSVPPRFQLPSCTARTATMVFIQDHNGTNGIGETGTRPRQGSRSLPMLTDILGNSLNDRLLFAVPKSRNHWLSMLDSG